MTLCVSLEGKDCISRISSLLRKQSRNNSKGTHLLLILGMKYALEYKSGIFCDHNFCIDLDCSLESFPYAVCLCLYVAQPGLGK